MHDKTVTQLAAALASGELSSRELTSASMASSSPLGLSI